ncbi:MAG TPA: type II secretion system protein [Bacilli bacterium]|nr:type II secretion system protein [Bacilli bacterium]
MIKKMIKGEKGFTLVELLAVIVILGIIVAIAIPAIGKVIEKAEEDADKAEVTMIIDAARLYDLQNDATYPVSVGTLISEGYLDPRQGTDLDLTATVTKEADGTFTYNEAPAPAP